MTLSDLYIGWSEQDVTPTRPVELAGQYYQRISRSVRDPLKVTALALETKAGPGTPGDQAIMLAADVVLVTREIQEQLRNRIRPLLPDFDPRKLFLNAIHTHNAPSSSLAGFVWWLPATDAMPSAEYDAFLMDRATQAVVNAWRNRAPGGVSRGFGTAAVGYCRRTLYADGTAMMYGRTDRPDFAGLEGSEDHGVELLCCWDHRLQLTGVVVNVACPSQVLEARYCVTADYLGEVRTQLRQRLGRSVFVLPQVSAAGDQSPRDLTRDYRGGPDFWHEDGAVEKGRRVVEAILPLLEPAARQARGQVCLRHTVRDLELPVRQASQAQYDEARAIFKRLNAREPADPRSPDAAFAKFLAATRANESRNGPGPYDDKSMDFVILRNHEAIIRHFESQTQHPTCPVELHVLRVDDVAFATNPFELFLDYGQQIKARSRATQTFVVQLTGDYLGYLPSERAVRAGGYGAMIVNGQIGPEGGRILVDETLCEIDRLWSDAG